MFEAITTNKKLDKKKYPDLKKRDAEWLAAIIQKTKYEAIAIDSSLSVGTVKNRFRIIFDELCVGDKQGFLNKYSDFEILYGDEFSFKASEK